jgi:hypothetical protein
MTKKQKMILEKYVTELKNLSVEKGSDREAIHIEADNLILSALSELGFNELTEAYDKVSDVGFWYA